jgi:archaemetzincin
MKRELIVVIVFAFFVGCTNNKKITVALQPFDDFKSNLTDTVAMAIEKTYMIKPLILRRVKIPSEAFVNTKTPRYRADKLIQYLRNQKPDSIDHIVGLTNQDISITKTNKHGNIKTPQSKYEDWGVFGYGYRPGESCIVSTYRLSKSTDNIFLNRIKKISLHELGHNLGLDHCESPDCVMRDAAETIRTIDQVKAGLCNQCRDKLK